MLDKAIDRTGDILLAPEILKVNAPDTYNNLLDRFNKFKQQ